MESTKAVPGVAELTEAVREAIENGAIPAELLSGIEYAERLAKTYSPVHAIIYGALIASGVRQLVTPGGFTVEEMREAIAAATKDTTPGV